MSQLDAYLKYWENVTVDTIDEIDSLVTPDFVFIHPFEELHGLADFKTMMQKMFKDSRNPKLQILKTVVSEDGNTAFITWDFQTQPNRTDRIITIRGVGEIGIAADGRILLHHDHWDAGGQLLFLFPVIGPIVKWVYKKIAVPIKDLSHPVQ